ncbi:MAG: response regulator transcription factor [Nitrospiraceae bacterium]|nr:response regulator transcription factor [Nitrospiraceae bacterium]
MYINRADNYISFEQSLLVIDNCERTRENLFSVFRGRIKIFIARTGSEGLDMLSENTGVVLLNYILPDMEGSNVLREIKIRYPSIPVIVMTSYGSEEICQKVFRLRAIDYIKKPLNIDEIRDKVDILLKIRDNKSGNREPLFFELSSDSKWCTANQMSFEVQTKIIKIKKYLDENYMVNIDMQKILKQACMNKTYFCNFFKIATGQTFKNYLINKRLEIAKKLLKNRKLSVSDIAYKIGYTPKYFSESFKKTVGISPRKFKKLKIDKFGNKFDYYR